MKRSEIQNSEIFFKQMIEISEETILPNDKSGSKVIQEKTFIFNKDSLNFLSCIDFNTYFLSSLCLTLTKFTYNKNILISKLCKVESNENNIGGSGENTLEKIPFSIKINTNNTTIDFLKYIQKQILTIKKYQHEFPNFKAAHDIKTGDKLVLPDLQYYHEKEKEEYKLPQSNLSIILNDVNEIKIKIIYNSSIYSEKIIQLFYDSLITVLKNFVKEDTLLKDIALAEFNTNSYSFKQPKIQTLNKLFEKVVENNKNKTALIATDKTLTFNDLDLESNIIANELIKGGLRKGDKVLIVLNRDSKLITSIFGVIKAGGVFIIVSPDDPTQKINFIKDQTDARFLISFKVFIDKILSYSKDSSPHTYFENNFESHGNGFCNKHSKSNGTFIFDINRLINGEDDRLPVVGLKSDDMLCIVYTSGSAGVPKGVLVTNRSLVNIFNSFDFEKWKFLLNFNQTFMPFMEFLLLSLYYGGTIVLANNEELFNPVHLFKNHSFDVLAMTPSRLEEYINNEELSSKLKDVKRIYLLGEKLRAILVEKLRKITHSEIYNLYGSSETGSTNIKLINDINTQNFGEISVGKPVFGVLERVLDIDDNPLPPLVIGQLMVGGSISDGYWNDTKLTNAKFVEINAIPFFKTGDLAKYDEKGNYSIIGRLDNQIKLRGQRIDPGEIENNVPEDIGVEKTIVTVNNKNDNQVLTLYFTTKSKSLMNDEIVKIKEMIRGHLVSVLPGFMVPQDYVYLEEFPKTSTGKVNVKDLKYHDDNIKEIIEPSNDLEQELFDICAEILGHTNFGVTNNLLNIGFTSLSLIRLSGKIFEEYHVQISSLDVIKNDYSISNIAKKIKVLKKVENVKNDVLEKKVLKKVENVKNDVLEKYPLSPNLYSYYKNVVKPRTPESKSFNNPVCLDFSDFDVFKLKNALLENIELNNYIKTSFIMEGGRIYQKRNDDLSVDIKIHEKELNDDIKKNFVKPFNIFEPPLFRLELYYHNGKVSLLFDIHHILIDRYSINMFFNDLIKLYFDKKIIKEYDYFDYSLEYSTKIIKKSAYSIKDSLKLFQLFLFNIFRIIKVWHDKINHSSSKMQMEAIFFDEETVLNFCKKSDISADEFFLSLVTLALAKLFDMRKIKLEFVFNGRTDIKYSQTFGYFSYTVPLFLNIESFYKFNILKFFNHVKKMKNKAILDSIDLMKDPQQYLKEDYSHLKFLDTIQDKFKFLFKQSNIKVLYNYITNMKFDTYSQLVEYDEIENINNLNENILHFTVFKTEDKFLLTVLYNSAYFVNEDDFVEYIESLFYKIIENPSKLNRL